MATDWKVLCADEAISIRGDIAEVTLSGGRGHRVQLREAERTIELGAVVAKAAAVREVKDLSLSVWLRNRTTQQVSFRVASDGSLRATGWVPKAGLQDGELARAVKHLAAECDRFEFHLTGGDVE